MRTESLTKAPGKAEATLRGAEAMQTRKDYRGSRDPFGYCGVIVTPGFATSGDQHEDGSRLITDLTRMGYEHAHTTEALGEDTVKDWRPFPPDGDGWVLLHTLWDEFRGEALAHWIRPARRPE